MKHLAVALIVITLIAVDFLSQVFHLPLDEQHGFGFADFGGFLLQHGGSGITEIMSMADAHDEMNGPTFDRFIAAALKAVQYNEAGECLDPKYQRKIAEDVCFALMEHLPASEPKPDYEIPLRSRSNEERAISHLRVVLDELDKCFANGGKLLAVGGVMVQPEYATARMFIDEIDNA